MSRGLHAGTALLCSECGMRLRSALFLLALAVTIPLLAFSAALAVVWSRQHQAAVEGGLVDTARAFAVAAERELEVSISALEALATSARLDTGDLAGFADEAQRVLPTQQWYTIFLADPGGQQVLRTGQPFETPLPSLADHPYFQRVVATGEPQVSDLIERTLSPGHQIAVAVPVARSGQLRYVLGAAMTPDVLSALLVTLPDPDHVASIVDRNDVVIARSKAPETFVGSRATPEYRAGIRRADEGVFRSGVLEGEGYYAGFTRVRRAGWTVGVGVTARALDVPFHRSLWLLALAAVGAIGLGSGGALVIGRRIARPMAMAATAAEALASGQPVAVPPPSIREVNVLTSALRESAALLERRERARADLDRRKDRLVARLKLVSETTADLLTAKTRAETTRTVFDRLSAELGLELYFNYLIDGDHLRLESSAGVDAGTVAALERLEFGQAICGTVAASARCCIAESVQASADAKSDLIRSLGVEAYACFPLVGEGRLIGTLSFGTRRRPAFDADEIELLETVANQVAIALERLQLVERLQRESVERQRAVREAEAARIEAERANRAKDDFLAVLSHELRTPLGAMLGWAQLLRSGRLDRTNAAHAVEVIERNIRLQTGLIDDLLDVSRIVAGKLHIERVRVELPAIVQRAVDSGRPAAAAKGVRLDAAIDRADPLVVSGDARRLEQIVANLLSNGVKFTPAGGLVAVRLGRAGDAARLVVRDTGIGIPRAFLPRMFDRFAQADARTNSAHGGLGLGLAITKHLVEAHGGTIEVASGGEGTGAAFAVTLPLLPLEASAAGEPTDATATGADRGALRDVRVLIVDDQPDTLEMLATVFEENEAVVRTAVSADEAVAAVDAFRPDVLVSDIKMPGRDGYDLIAALRAIDGLPPVSAIALTAYASIEDAERARTTGFDLHLAKPVDPGILVSAVSALLSRRRGG
jgi:signal transduction histidine kinase/ActR/RegA family two-component response regulator